MRRTLIAVVAAFFVTAVPALAQEAAAEHPDRPADLVLTVEGFSCSHCTAKLQKELAKLDGAQAVVAAEWEEGTVSIWLEEGADLEEEQLTKTVKNAGFVLKEVRRAEAEPAPAS
jgi:copper chaperone CopZ